MSCQCHYIHVDAIETVDVIGDAFPAIETTVEITGGLDSTSGYEPGWGLLRQAPINQLTGQATQIPEGGEGGTDYVQTYSVKFVRVMGSKIPVRIHYEVEQWQDGSPFDVTQDSVLLGANDLETGGIDVIPSGTGSENIAYLRVLYLEIPGL
jgi:hypothetical protein